MPCFFFPAESLISLPVLPNVSAVTTSAASSTLTSLSLAPPPVTKRRISDLDLPSSSCTKRSTSGTPAATSAAESCTRGSASVAAEPPSPPKRDLAVCCICAKQSSPCSMLVASFASTTLASLMAAPERVSSSSICSCGSSVKMRRNRPTSASAVLRQNCQYSNGVSRSLLSQTAPLAVLPIFLPSAVVSNGAVSPKSEAPSTRRASSTPLMMLPHWSEPPNCSTAPSRRCSSRKSYACKIM
mmetsp:Transcript_20002/g.46148  ORF Transcript_20002/g.46148 Transcript_20002/m.46148 type:complete len:242 (+) Transcript_20002:279-1004(+)